MKPLLRTLDAVFSRSASPETSSTVFSYSTPSPSHVCVTSGCEVKILFVLNEVQSSRDDPVDQFYEEGQEANRSIWLHKSMVFPSFRNRDELAQFPGRRDLSRRFRDTTRLDFIAEQKGILPRSQAGFRRGRTTENPLLLVHARLSGGQQQTSYYQKKHGKKSLPFTSSEKTQNEQRRTRKKNRKSIKAADQV